MELPSRALHEVVKAVERCSRDDGACRGCPYYKDNGKYECFINNGNHYLKDILYWLKVAERNSWIT